MVLVRQNSVHTMVMLDSVEQGFGNTSAMKKRPAGRFFYGSYGKRLMGGHRVFEWTHPWLGDVAHGAVVGHDLLE